MARPRGTGRVFTRGSSRWIAYCHRGEERRESVALALGMLPSQVKVTDAWNLLKKRLAEMEDGRYVAHQDRVVFGNLLDSLVSIVRGLVERWGSRPLTSIKPEDIDVWWADLRARVRPATSNRHLVRVKHFFDTATRWRYLTANPLTHIRKRREPRGRVRYLEPVQLAALMMAAPLWLRRYIVVARYAPAGRRSDIHALRRQDLDLEAGTLTFPHTKNGDSVTTPLHTRVRAVLSPLPKNPDAYLLRQIAVQHVTRAFHKLCAGLGLHDFHFHDLRHDAGSALGMAGVQQRAIMEVLGHRDPRMSIRYTHLSSAAVRTIMEESL